MLFFHSFPIGHVYTRRSISEHRGWHLVWEWEECFASLLKWPLYAPKRAVRPYDHIPYRIMRASPFFAELLCPWQWELLFEMIPDLSKPLFNARRRIPCIVDYFLTDDLLPVFLENYQRCPIILISSREAYQHILDSGYPQKMGVKIGHLPLSISDKYSLMAGGERKYDVAILGRTNPVLLNFLSRYMQTHDISYVIRKDDEEDNVCYDSYGNQFGFISSREQYLGLMRQTKVALYSTPGIDGGESRCHGFSQVTPRFLEHLVCGNHIIARYANNEDTDYYELGKFSQSIETYEQFEEKMDYYLSHDIDQQFYVQYLSRHYTSVRVEQFKSILKQL